MTPERERLLAEAWKVRHDRSALEELVCLMEGLNRIVARRWRLSGVELDELLAVGRQGVVRAVETFDPALGRFSTYARHWIFAEQAKLAYGFHLHGMTHVPMAHSSKQQPLHGMTRRLGCLYPHDQHLGRLAQASGKDPKYLAAWQASLSSHCSLNAPITGESDAAWQDMLRDPTLGPQEAAEDRERTKGIRGLASVALGALDARERLVVEKRFLVEEPLTLQDIATELDLSRERVRQLEQRALKKMRQVLQVDP